jgi:hypothetical protein
MSNLEPITLKAPFEDHNGEMVKVINLKEPDAGMLRKIKGNLMTDMHDMCCQYVELSSGLPKSLVNKIGPHDLNQQILPVFLSFFGDSQ